MLKIGDKIKYVKASSFIEMPIGTEMTVTDIKGSVVAVEANFQFGNCKAVTQCVMSYDEFEKHFEKVVETKTKSETPKRVWTEWAKIDAQDRNQITNCAGAMCGKCASGSFCGKMEKIEYRTNGKKIKVRYKIGENQYINSEATCHKEDIFNLFTGLKVAVYRLGVKLSQYYLKTLIKEIG